MNVHTGTVITHDWQGMNVAVCRRREQRYEYSTSGSELQSALRVQSVCAYTVLTTAVPHFVVVNFDAQAHGFHGITHCATQVVQ